MDIIRLSKEIDNKIKIAEAYLPTLLANMEQFHELGITYRIKDKQRILEKIMLWKNNPKLQDINEIDLLNNINDIIGLTVVVNEIDDAFEAANKIISFLETQKHSVKFNRCIDHISDNGGVTGYRGLLLMFDDKEAIPFEIQVTDSKNLEIRNNTHEEFEKTKYSSVRTQIVQDYEKNTHDTI